MASSRTSRCQICQKRQAFFICHHCRGDFCEDHINAHQDPPDPHRQDVRHEHQQLQAMIDEYRVQPSQHPLLAEINRWERGSIEQIQQIANEARMQFSNGINDHLARIEKALEQLKRHVDRLDKDDERVLQRWSKRVDELRTALIHPKNQDGSTFISKLCLEIVEPTDLFERATGPLRIVDRGHSIVHGQWSDHASVRGKGEYSFVQHQFRFKIEQLSADQWLFLGIASATAPNNPVSIVTPTAHGFAGQNGLCLNGVYRNTFDDQNYAK